MQVLERLAHAQGRLGGIICSCRREVVRMGGNTYRCTNCGETFGALEHTPFKWLDVPLATWASAAELVETAHRDIISSLGLGEGQAEEVRKTEIDGDEASLWRALLTARDYDSGLLTEVQRKRKSVNRGFFF
ncbi:hypothetical protein JJB11_07535 [Ramlibacter ginsenosidimutans]|uniref:Uncharacterized protein n=1 Tax=Ramlibacter ginsenosidimutans TaxID=502333 RepID=A0A934WKP7_9BURK|nr:hypothetical protein [Ramlibacter ginsenosidimutans]MBK6005944.1 hypothetical protein [Ramlibacter ginsenosidimutans]